MDKKERGAELSAPSSPFPASSACGIIRITTKGAIQMRKAADIIRDILKAENISGRELARRIGRVPSAVSTKLKNNTLTAEVFFDWCDKLGYEVIVQRKGDGERIDGSRRGIGPRLRRMVGKIIYDTEKSAALCHTPEQDGWFMELYVDDDGRFFVAHYTDWEGSENFISQVNPEEARRLYDTYGDGSADGFFEGGSLPDDDEIDE